MVSVRDLPAVGSFGVSPLRRGTLQSRISTRTFRNTELQLKLVVGLFSPGDLIHGDRPRRALNPLSIADKIPEVAEQDTPRGAGADGILPVPGFFLESSG